MFPAVICVLVHLVAASPSIEPYPVVGVTSNPSTAASLPSITTKITTSGNGGQSMPPSETMSTATLTYMSTTSPPVWTTPAYPDVPTEHHDGQTDKTDEPTTPERVSEEVTESPVTATEPSNDTDEKEEEQDPSAAQTIRLSELLLRLLAVFIIVSLYVKHVPLSP